MDLPLASLHLTECSMPDVSGTGFLQPETPIVFVNDSSLALLWQWFVILK